MPAQFPGGFRFAGLSGVRALVISLILGVLGTLLLLSIMGAVEVVSAPGESDMPTNPGSVNFVSTSSTSPAPVYITKTVDPPSPDTGGTVTICFTIRRPGLDVVLAQDVSTSMDRPVGEGATQTRLEACQVAASAFVNSLQSADRAAVVAYSRTADLAQPLTTSISSITRTIYDLTATGRTNMGEAISVSREELTTPSSSDATKVIILLSDGNANCDRDRRCGDEWVSDAVTYTLEQVELAANDNIRIFTVAFGDAADVNTPLLETIAITTGGEYYFAPDGDALAATYLAIALALRNLVITDTLTPSVDVDCSQWPDGLCVEGPDGATTVIFPISDSSLISNPLTRCFTATVNLDPDYEGPINDPSSHFCYQDPRDPDGEPICPSSPFVNPPITVTGRKITGLVFCDWNKNGHRDSNEPGADGVVVRTSTSLIATTDDSGTYVLRTSNELPLSVTIEISPVYVTTPVLANIPCATGIYTVDFGICVSTYLPSVIRNYPLPVITNGGFEDNGDRWTGWMHGGELNQTIVSANPHWGSFSALLGDPGYECRHVPIGSAWVEQTVLVPTTTAPELSFWYNIWTYDRNRYLDNRYDLFEVKVNGAQVFEDMKMSGAYGCADLPTDLGWRHATIGLSDYSGSHITIRFANWNRPDNKYNTWTYVDDVRIDP